MNHPLALNLWGLPPDAGREPGALRDDLARARSWGYGALEATCGPGDRLRFGDGPGPAANLRRAAEEEALPIVSLCSGATWEWHLNSVDPARRRRARLAVEELIETASRLGEGLVLLLTPGTTTMPADRGRGVTADEAWERAAEALRPLARRASERGVVLALENSWTRFLVSPREARAFLDEIAEPALGWYVDVGNAGLTADPTDWIRTLGPRIRMVQAKDFRPTPEGGRFVPIGEGAVDWTTVLEALDDTGYTGPIVVESPPDPGAAARAAAFLLRLPGIAGRVPSADGTSGHPSAGDAPPEAPAHPRSTPRPGARGPDRRRLRVAIVGLGFMGRLHAQRLLARDDIALTAIVDPTGRFVIGTRRFIRGVRRLRRILGLSFDRFPPPGVRRLRTLEELICGPLPDAVWLCTPTDLHAAPAREFLARGRHVFCEKPLALTAVDARSVVDAARGAAGRLVVGHCVRFWPEWRFLTERIHDRRYGRLRELDLWRVCGRPIHSEGGWLDDPARSGGGVLDLHVHDADFLLGLPEPPASVRAEVLRDESGAPQHVRATYRYVGEDAPTVRCRAGWLLPPGSPFRAGYRALFERGLLALDDGEPGLRWYPEAGGAEGIDPSGEFPGGDAFDGQLDATVDLFTSGRAHFLLDIDRAARAVALVEAEIRSDACGGSVDLAHAPTGAARTVGPPGRPGKDPLGRNGPGRG